MNEFLKKIFLIKENIITFDIHDTTTKKVTDFYKDSPFPNYKIEDSKATISTKGNNNVLTSQFKKLLDMVRMF